MHRLILWVDFFFLMAVWLEEVNDQVTFLARKNKPDIHILVLKYFSLCDLFFLDKISSTSVLNMLWQCHVDHCSWTVRGNMGYLNWERPSETSGASSQRAEKKEELIIPSCEDQHLSALCNQEGSEGHLTLTARLFSKCSKKILER